MIFSVIAGRSTVIGSIFFNGFFFIAMLANSYSLTLHPVVFQADVSVSQKRQADSLTWTLIFFTSNTVGGFFIVTQEALLRSGLGD